MPFSSQFSAAALARVIEGTGLHFCHPVIGEMAFQERLADIAETHGREFRASLVLVPANGSEPERCTIIHPQSGQIGCLPLAENPDVRDLLRAQDAPLAVTAQIYGGPGHYGLWIACDLLPCAAPPAHRPFALRP